MTKYEIARQYDTMSLQESDVITPDDVRAAETSRERWNHVRKGAALYAQLAIQSRDWVRLEQARSILDRATMSSDMMAGAIMARAIPETQIYATLEAAGRQAGEEDVRAAYAAIAANAAAKSAAISRAAESRRAEAAVDRAERREQKVATSGLQIGQLVNASWTYQQSKRQVATTECGQIISLYATFGAGSGQVRITRFDRRGRAEGEKV